jgi:phosphopantothenoylcysteine decarboxylase
MNTAMWQHPVTARQVRLLEEEWVWFEVLRPQEKKLMCADYGYGAMMEWMHIVRVIETRLGLGNAEANGS